MNKTDLIQKIKQLEGISQDERAYLINLVNTKKKYGLVWEDKPEDAEEQLRTQLPVLREVVEKRIMSQPRLNRLKDGQDKEAPFNAATLFPEFENPENLLNPENHGSDNFAPNHILIEGDNLHALTALTFTHEGKIDVMYFDPPYNTGNKDFKYNDSYVDKEDTYRHSKWLSFMDKRLRIAKRLLSDKGVIFISIDDNEQAQLKLLCGEVFGEENLIAEFIWRTDGNFDNQAQIKNCHEYIMSYAKNSSTFKVSAIIDPNVNEDSKLYKDNIQNTIVKNGPKNPMSEVYLPAGFPSLFENGRIISRTNKFPHYSEDVTVESYKTTIGTIVKSGWSSKTLLELYIKNDYTPVIDSKNQLTEFKISETGSIEAIKVRADQSHVISVLMNMGNTQNNSNRLLEMGIKFSYPKPQTLLQYLVGIIPNKKIIILDIFAGSGTTLHATIQLNDDDGGNRQCILVTNNEIDEKTQKELEIKGLVKGTPEFEAYGICQSVTYERNRRVIQGYTNSKGEWVSGLTNNNLRYYKSEFVGREPSLKNKRELTRLATELLCIKEDCYDEQEIAIKQAKLFANVKVMLLVLFDDHIIPDAVEFIKKQINGITIKVYVFSMGSDPYTEDFYEVSDKIELCALPDAIYKAYRSVLPKNKRFIIADDEKMEEEMNKE